MSECVDGEHSACNEFESRGGEETDPSGGVRSDEEQAEQSGGSQADERQAEQSGDRQADERQAEQPGGRQADEKEPDAVSSELYRLFASLGRRREQKVTTASASGEEGLLHYLAFQKDGVSSGFLREQLQVGSGRMADILRRLEEKQLIVRCDDEKDSRRVLVYITESGRAQAIRTQKRVLAWYRKLWLYLGEEDGKELMRILTRLVKFTG